MTTTAVAAGTASASEAMVPAHGVTFGAFTAASDQATTSSGLLLRLLLIAHPAPLGSVALSLAATLARPLLFFPLAAAASGGTTVVPKDMPP
jgi:hypothetical protein